MGTTVGKNRLCLGGLQELAANAIMRPSLRFAFPVRLSKRFDPLARQSRDHRSMRALPRLASGGSSVTIGSCNLTGLLAHLAAWARYSVASPKLRGVGGVTCVLGLLSYPLPVAWLCLVVLAAVASARWYLRGQPLPGTQFNVPIGVYAAGALVGLYAT